MRLPTRKHLESASGQAWWDTRWAVPGLMLLSTAPLWMTPLPPLIDLLGHIGRYHVELEFARSSALQRNWAFHWAVVGNLGVDLLIVPLAHLLGLERAAWLVALALPPLMIWAIARVCRAAHGQLTPGVIASAPFALAYPYQYGFVNFWLGCALALHVFASWVRDEGLGERRRAAVFGLAASAVWITHAYSWAVLVVLVAAFELARVWRREPQAWRGILLGLLRRIWPVLLPAVFMVAWRQGAGSAETQDFFNFGAKLAGFLRTLRDQDRTLDLASLAFAIGALGWGLGGRRNRLDGALGLAALVFLGLIVAMPRQLFGSAFADIRLCPIFLIVALLATAPAVRPSRAASLVAATALVVFVARIAVMTTGFAAYEQTYERRLQALNYMPRGASVAVLVMHPRCDGWRQARVSHLAALAIVRRDAFVNSEWDIAGAQLVRPLGGRGTAFNADPSQYVLPGAGCHADPGPALAQKIAAIPRDRFGYLWLFGFDPARVQLPDGMRRLYADERSGFYAFSPAMRF